MRRNLVEQAGAALRNAPCPHFRSRGLNVKSKPTSESIVSDEKTILNIIALAIYMIFLLVALTGKTPGEPVTVNAKIDSVTAYRDRARVTRTVELNLPSGVSELVFQTLPSAISEDSVRVSASGARVLHTQVRVVERDVASEAKIRQAKDRLRAIELEEQNPSDEAHRIEEIVREEVAQTDIIETEKAGIAFLENLKISSQARANEQMLAGTPNPEGWVGALDLMATSLGEGKRKIREAEDRIAGLQKERAGLERGLDLQARSISSRSVFSIRPQGRTGRM